MPLFCEIRHRYGALICILYFYFVLNPNILHKILNKMCSKPKEGYHAETVRNLCFVKDIRFS